MRAAKFSNSDIINAASGVIATSGPARASVARIARSAGAPTGSVYHRFASRSVLFGHVWLKAVRDFQSAFAQAAAQVTGPPFDPDFVTFVPRYVRRHPVESRLLLLHRREEFLDTKWPAALKNEAKELGEELARIEIHLSRTLCGRDDPETRAILRYAVADAPIAAVRPYIEGDKPPPPFVDQLVTSTFGAVFALMSARR